MSRTSRTLTNTDLAFLLCTTATQVPQGQSSKATNRTSRNFSLSFETDYGLMLSLEPDDSITITFRKPPPAPQKQYTDPFDSGTPIKSQQLFALSPVSPVSASHGSIDGVLFSPLGLGTGGATITPARSTPSRPTVSTWTPTLTRTSSQNQTSSTRNMATSKSNSPAPLPKIKYYIRPGLDAKCSSHMYYTSSAFTQPQPQPQPQPQHQPSDGSSIRQKLRLHRVKESHLQSLYHHPSPSSSHANSNSWFDSYLDWIDRLEDACALAQQRQQRQHAEPQTPITPTPCTAVPLSPAPATTSRAQTNQGAGPFTDEGEKSLWLVEGLLLASWLSLQEGVEGVEYVPLPSSEVYRLEHVQGNNAGVMMRRLLERIGAGE